MRILVNRLILVVFCLSMHSTTHAQINKNKLPKTSSKNFVKQPKFQGGTGTRFGIKGPNSFSLPAANLNFEEQGDFALGNALFRRIWVSSPSSTKSTDGLGPLFNARSCQRCHIKDGRGHLPEIESKDDNSVSMLLRLGIPVKNPKNKLQTSKPDPTYGGQLQDVSIQGIDSEGNIQIKYTKNIEFFDDGTKVELIKPIFSVKNLKYGPLDQKTLISPRIAPQMIGMGLLESIPNSRLKQLADPFDKNQNGISGKIAKVDFKGKE